MSLDKVVGVSKGTGAASPLGVSVSALFDPSKVDLGAVEHVSGPLQRVLMQLSLFGEEGEHGER